MGKKLFVGNLSFDTTGPELEALFSEIGPCDSAAVITDRATGRSRGFGFVEMDAADADKAIRALDQEDFSGRNLKVNEAQPRERDDRGGGGGGGGRPQRSRW
jgi:RNA recognition motif-containing protein